jgi:hypothetical protein
MMRPIKPEFGIMGILLAIRELMMPAMNGYPPYRRILRAADAKYGEKIF